MRITEITLTNFRCFGPDSQKVRLSELTALVGSNACGKTALLVALQRLFGASSSDREIQPEDFHVPRTVDSEAERVTERTLAIEVTLEFPELEDPEADEDAVAECFRQMVVTEAGGTPFCIVRLDAEWTAEGAPEGIVEQHTYWVRPTSKEGEEETKHEMRPVDRARIHLHYVPAARDPVKQIRQVSGSIMARLLKAVKWSNEVQESVLKSSAEIQEVFGDEDGVGSIQSALTKNWKILHDAGVYSGVKIRPVSNRFEDLLRQVEAVFSPSPGGYDDPLERLSDGQRSLFYIAMVGAAFDIESQVVDGDEESKGFDGDMLSPPSLTIFAVEEPENHVAPHFLGGIMKVLRRLPESGRAQVVLTSHSPSILHRVEPEEVRHLRLDTESQATLVREILLPQETDESHKFIREAVRAYPELYFARLVVLGEGDSEEVVLPKVAESFRVAIDQSFVSIVPLGGRHVNHMWRLLNALEIPHLTLLDFDQERKGGSWGRIKYAVNQLLAVGVPKAELLAVDDDKGGTMTLGDSELNKMHTWKLSEVEPARWVECLEGYGVYFSSPLDLDFLMLQHYPDAYHGTVGTDEGPEIPKNGAANYDAKQAAVIRAVLKEAGGDGESYKPEEVTAFYWYRYLFLTRGKPTTHLKALSGLTPKEIRTSCPPVLKRLVKKMRGKLTRPAEDGTDAA